jgi:hypothetical protein
MKEVKLYTRNLCGWCVDAKHGEPVGQVHWPRIVSASPHQHLK